MFTIHVEIADDIDEQKDGLSNRLTLDDDSGMLFVYKSKSKQRFWMKDTYIPLDISFVDDDGTIKEIYELEPFEEKPVESKGEYRFVLETKRGVLFKNSFGIGSKVNLEDLKKEKEMSKKLAAELVKLAKELAAQDFGADSFEGEMEEQKGVFKRMDPALNSAVMKVMQVTNGDLGKMLTVILMALKKSGHAAEANKIYTIFKQVLKRIEQVAPAL